jgi:hypothetical protein
MGGQSTIAAFSERLQLTLSVESQPAPACFSISVFREREVGFFKGRCQNARDSVVQLLIAN